MAARLNLPFVGVQTFMRAPYVSDWSAIRAHIAFMGAPYDMGTQVRTGARHGPHAVREASMLFGQHQGGFYDPETNRSYLDPAVVSIVDIGDADMIHADPISSLANIEHGVRSILASGALPVVIGGDHSVNIPCLRAYAGQSPLHIIHIDAHLDYVDQRAGVSHGQGSPLRRAAELQHVEGITHLGIRGQGSSSATDFRDALEQKSRIISVREFRRLGTSGVLARIPQGRRYYLTIDVDGFDPSIAPGTGTPSSGGFLYYEIIEFLEILAQRGTVVGVDIVEISPPHDPSGATPIFVTQLLVTLLGFIFATL
jgi:agmatinase